MSDPTRPYEPLTSENAARRIGLTEREKDCLWAA